MKVTLSHDAVEISGPEVRNFFPALLAPMAARLGKAVLNKVKAAITAPPPPSEIEGEEVEGPDVGIEVEGDTITLSHDHLPFLSDEDQNALLSDVNTILQDEIREYADTMALLNDLVEAADNIQDDGSPEVAHFKKKLKKLKKLAMKGLKFASPFASLIPGGSIATGLLSGLTSKKGRGGLLKGLVGSVVPGGEAISSLIPSDSSGVSLSN